MTLANLIPQSSRAIRALTLQYRVAMPQPETHCFEVQLLIPAWAAATLRLQMPVWTPGSYLVREYARHVRQLSACATTTQTPLATQKVSKNCWQIETENVGQITVNYTVFAHELTVRTNHLDATHGYFNGAALFLYIPGFEKSNFIVEIMPPKPDWSVFTPLPAHSDRAHTFTAPDLDTLVDSPFEIGPSQIYPFTALGKPHQWVIWGSGNYQIEQIIADTQQIIATEAAIFGNELPYEEYTFLLHLAVENFGGLEHKNCCSLIYTRLGFRDRDKYIRFMQLVAHEYFHLWNVKRIRPQALEVFDYTQENYTRALWFCEGTTSYYDVMVPHWAGLYDLKGFCEVLTKDVNRYLLIPGRKIQSLSDSSFDTWIKLYRREAHSDNDQISYYLKGAMFSLLLDLLIRKRHRNARSLNDVMRRMWAEFGREEIGYTDAQLKAVIESVAGCDLTDFFAKYLDGLEELPLAAALVDFGLTIKPQLDKHTPPYLGVRVNEDQGRAQVQFVASDSPAAAVGISPGDELVALEGWRLKAAELNDRLLDYRAGDAIALTVFQADRLCTHTITLTEPQPQGYQVVPLKNPTPEQVKLQAGWLRVDTAA